MCPPGVVGQSEWALHTDEAGVGLCQQGKVLTGLNSFQIADIFSQRL